MRKLVLVLLLALVSGAGAVGFGADKREPMPAQADLPWRAIGRITFEGGLASGTLVGPNLVLTAKHAVFDTETGKAYDKMTFTSAANGPRGHAESSAVVHVWFKGERSAANGFPYDWALLVLDRSLGNIFGWLGVKSFDPGEDPLGFPVTFYGYAGNPHELHPEWAMGRSPYCSAGHFRISKVPNLLVHDCSTWPGSSGGALVVWSHSKPWIAGVHVAGYRDDMLPAEVKQKARGGFLQDFKPGPAFWEEYGNISVAMDRPIDTLQGLPIPTHHQLSVENQCTVNVRVAAVFESDNYHEQQVNGYLTVAPGETVKLVEPRDGLTASEVYFHAHADDGYTWGSGSWHAKVGDDPVERPFVKLQFEAPSRKLVLTRK